MKASLSEATASLTVYRNAARTGAFFSLSNNDTDASLTSSSSTAASQRRVVDSGASHNMCNDWSYFISFTVLPSPITIKLGDETTVITTFHGFVNISHGFQLHILYTPTFRLTLLSINQLDLAEYTITFRRGTC